MPVIFRQLRIKNYVSDPLEDSTKPGVMILMISVPLYDENGQIVGVLSEQSARSA